MQGRGALAGGSGASIPAPSISEVSPCLWGHPCPKYPLALPQCPGPLPSDPAGTAAPCPIHLPGSIDAAGQAPLVIGSSPAAPLDTPAPARAPGCSDALPPPPLPFQGDSASPWCTQSRERRMSPGCTGTHRDVQGPTMPPHLPIPALNPSSAPASPAAASNPGSDCASPQPPSTAMFCCWGRNK